MRWNSSMSPGNTNISHLHLQCFFFIFPFSKRAIHFCPFLVTGGHDSRVFITQSSACK